MDSPAKLDRLKSLMVGAVLLAAIMRLPGLFMSLWYDELFTLLHFINAPWSAVVGGEYSPNNHILFTLIAKLFASMGDGKLAPLLTRLPSLLAGIGAAVLLAWPLRKSRPGMAAVVLLLVAVHPWAVIISNWVRGYSLLLVLALASTHLLAQRRVGWQYAALLAAAIYTLPLGVLLLPGHAAVLLLPTHRDLSKRWLAWAGAALAKAAVLYLPFATGARAYWAQGSASVSYLEFVAGSFRHACAGYNVPAHWPMVVGALLCCLGTVLAWQRWAEMRPLLLVFSVAAILALAAPLLAPRAGEVRATVWLIPLFGVGLAAGLESLWRLGEQRRVVIVGRSLAVAMAVATAVCLLRFDYVLWETPAQPIGNAVMRGRLLAGEGGTVVGVYMAAAEASATYGGLDAVVMKEAQLQRVEALAPRPLVAVVFYPHYLERNEPALWRRLERDYQRLERLPGIVSPADVYRHR